jgi:hypothetical protein
VREITPSRYRTVPDPVGSGTENEGLAWLTG